MPFAAAFSSEAICNESRKRPLPYISTASYFSNSPASSMVSQVIFISLQSLLSTISAAWAGSDRSERKISSSRDDFAAWIISVSDNSCTASHVRYLRIRIARLIILKIERSVNKREVREQSLSRNTAGKFEQIIVRVGRIKVNALFYLEYVDREYRSFAVAKSCLRYSKNMNRQLLRTVIWIRWQTRRSRMQSLHGYSR